MTRHCYHKLRAAYQAEETRQDKHLVEEILHTFQACPIPEIARLAKPYGAGKTSSPVTSQLLAPTTAEPKRATASSKFTDESHSYDSSKNANETASHPTTHRSAQTTPSDSCLPRMADPLTASMSMTTMLPRKVCGRSSGLTPSSRIATASPGYADSRFPRFDSI